MKKFLELETKIYKSKEINKYIKDTNVEEEESWKAAIAESVAPPDYILSKVYIDPDKIISFIETFSLEESYYNPESPTLDTVEIQLQEGIDYQVTCDMQEFLKRLKAFYNSK